MPHKEDDFLKLRNHREVRDILEAIAGTADLSWFDTAALTVCRRWFRLAQNHLRGARRHKSLRTDWRMVISRCYYAVYNASKAVRYCSEGAVKLDGDDHKRVGDLPKDFPDQSIWSSFAQEMRKDRNLADYEPWPHVYSSLTYQPKEALEKSVSFVREARRFMRTRGVKI